MVKLNNKIKDLEMKTIDKTTNKKTPKVIQFSNDKQSIEIVDYDPNKMPTSHNPWVDEELRKAEERADFIIG
jgi:hypothetical protein